MLLQLWPVRPGPAGARRSQLSRAEKTVCGQAELAGRHRGGSVRPLCRPLQALSHLSPPPLHVNDALLIRLPWQVINGCTLNPSWRGHRGRVTRRFPPGRAARQALSDRPAPRVRRRGGGGFGGGRFHVNNGVRIETFPPNVTDDVGGERAEKGRAGKRITVAKVPRHLRALVPDRRAFD
ncbi:hypothetical protein SKAU_G00153760 [Synaphobranchus kaupii]|uniref:Uncharacterized protein n=1 Tax=Synaphobranchus kaupii TaxID=118154 RepID=A0A9Q1FH93_SYNKA|nr:hypothetical protein SKAU_G00153760 [Synaphobranchus kaupii]